MNKKSIIFFSLITLVALSVTAYQYFNTFEADFAKAYTSGKPANGHLWTEMECSQGLCVTSGNNVGIGTDSPADKLDVTGNVGVTGNIIASGSVGIGTASPTNKLEVSGTIKGTDVCSSGICLSQVAVLYSANPLYNSTHTIGNCATAGGTVIANPSGTGLPICQFSNSSGISCPSGWTQYSNWSTTIATSGGVYIGTTSAGNSDVCYCSITTVHNWSNTAREYCHCNSGYNPSGGNLYATYTQIGCY
jgi:hypothetical protein